LLFSNSVSPSAPTAHRVDPLKAPGGCTTVQPSNPEEKFSSSNVWPLTVEIEAISAALMNNRKYLKNDRMVSLFISLSELTKNKERTLDRVTTENIF
jgi:hypothetical protein